VTGLEGDPSSIVRVGRRVLAREVTATRSASPSASYPRRNGSDRHAERDLFLRYQTGGDEGAREALVDRFLPLARALARRYRRTSEPLEDLEQVASVGLVKAIDRFDLSRETAFSSYLVPTVLGELKRHFRDCGWAAHVPRRMQERVMRITSTADKLASQRGRSPSIAEIAVEIGHSPEEVLEAMEASHAFHARPLDAPHSEQEEDPGHLSELGRREAGYELVELGVAMKPAIQELPQREREILRLRFVDDLTQSQIAERIGISQMHVSRLLRAAVERLRAATGENADPCLKTS
jgi:RNA polymerase sigma-B factor